MNKIPKILLSLIIIIKITLNGVGFFGISIWFYLVALYISITIMQFINRRMFIDSGYKKYFLSIVIMLFMMVFVALINEKFDEKIVYLINFLSMILFSLSVYLMIKNDIDIKRIVQTIIISISISAVIGIIQIISYEQYLEIINFLGLNSNNNMEITGRINGLSTTAITFSYELLIGFILTLREIIKNKRLTFIPFSFIIGIALMLNQTRSAILALFLVILWIFMQNHGSRNIGKKIFFLTSLALILPLSLEFFGVTIRLFNEDFSGNSRLPMIFTAFEYSFQFPFGTAVYDLSRANIDLSKYSLGVVNIIINNYTHNQFTNILVDYGYIGLFIMTSIYVLFISKHIQNSKNMKYDIYWILVIFAFTVNALAHNTGIFSIEPIIWLCITIFFKHYNLHENYYSEVTI